MIRVIKTKQDFEEILNSPAMAIYFNSDACGVCHAVLPQLDTMLTSDFPKIPLYVINANESLELCASLSVFTFPTVLIYFEGKESLRIARNINLSLLRNSLERPYDILFS